MVERVSSLAPLRSPCIGLRTHASHPSPSKDVVARGVRKELLVVCDGGVDLGPVRGRVYSWSSTAPPRTGMSRGAINLHVTQLALSPVVLTSIRRTSIASLTHLSAAVAAGQRLIRGLCEHVEQFVQHYFRTAGCAHSAALAPPPCILFARRPHS